jgi:signal peptidase I
MSGSGARDGYGSPPWDPAEPVPDPQDTQAVPGLGNVGRNAGGAHRRRPDSAGPDSSGPDSGSPVNVNGDVNSDVNVNGDGDGQGADAAKGKRRRSFWRELPFLVIVALVLALLIKTFAIQAFFIPSASMENTLEIGDRVLINKIVYHLRPIHRGDIVVFDGTGSWDLDNPPRSSNIFSKAVDELEGIVGISHDSSIYIKRVIGLPGDHVACCTTAGQLTVNGVPLSEDGYLYPGEAPSTQRFNITVPAGRLWVMGDHRLVSYDSRGHMGDPGGGTIPQSAVLGRAFVTIWPLSRLGFLNIPATFEQPQLNAANTAGTTNGASAQPGGATAELAAAMDNGTPIRPATSPLPLVLGFAGAIPVTWLRSRARDRRRARRARRPRG